MSPLLILRVHADLRLGLGHVARALALEEAWRFTVDGVISAARPASPSRAMTAPAAWVAAPIPSWTRP